MKSVWSCEKSLKDYCMLYVQIKCLKDYCMLYVQIKCLKVMKRLLYVKCTNDWLWISWPSSYERVDEIIWVKTNQLQRIIRTGRTGHWLNHGKEHCLVSSFRSLFSLSLSQCLAWVCPMPPNWLCRCVPFLLAISFEQAGCIITSMPH